MNTTTKKLGTLIAAAFLTGLCSQAYGQTTIFGSAGNGDGGFTNSPLSGTEAWTVETGSVKYAYGTLGVDESHTASLLKSFTLDKSAGSQYTIEGVVDLTAGYGDDNNRIGLLLFNSTDTQTADGGGGLYLRLKADDGGDVGIMPGINGTALASTATGVAAGDDWIGQTLTFSADLTFKNDGVDDRFDLSFTMTDASSTDFTATISDLLVSDYSGEYFGFATKWRQRGTANSLRDAPAEMNYKSFSITAIPEPSTLAFLVFSVVLLAKFRRRK